MAEINMAIKSEEEWRQIISDRLSYWIYRISGGELIASKKIKEMEEITNQVIERRNKKLKKV